MAALKPFADDLEIELTCSICQDIFNEPKTLSCLHSFCAKCIVQWYDQSGNKATKRFECPICKSRIDVPDGDGSKLRSSFYLHSLLKIYRPMRALSDEQQAELSECASCQEHLKLVAFCPQCNGLMCNECVKAHKRVRQLRLEHQAEMLANFKKENVVKFVKSQMFCQEKYHEQYKVEYYCTDNACKKCICQKCAILDHQRHVKLDTEQFVEKARQAITQNTECVEKVQEKFEQELVKSKQNMVKIDNEIDLALLKVDEVVESIHRMARDHEAKMKEELIAIRHEERKAHEDEERDIKATINEIEEFLKRCKNVRDKTSANEISASEKEIQKTCQAYSEMPSTLTDKLIHREVKVDYVVGQEITQFLPNIGKVVKRETQSQSQDYVWHALLYKFWKTPNE